MPVNRHLLVANAPAAVRTFCSPSYPTVWIPPARKIGDLACWEIVVALPVIHVPHLAAYHSHELDGDFDEIEGEWRSFRADHEPGDDIAGEVIFVENRDSLAYHVIAPDPFPHYDTSRDTGHSVASSGRAIVYIDRRATNTSYARRAP